MVNMGNWNMDITAPVGDNETWNDCPYCKASWKDEISIPGLLHRTRLCHECKDKILIADNSFNNGHKERNTGRN